MRALVDKIPSLLVANRGEIACRIFRTARRFGIRTIAVHSEADAGARHVREADQAIPIGPSPARESYLVAERIIAAARAAGAAAIHPGYGFLSENAEFAEACAAAGILFVGPPPAAIRAMGLKDAAKRIAEEAGAPVVPGYHGTDQNPARLAAEAERIGFPVLIKAVAGGGGKGMKRVDRAEDFAEALASAAREALSAFGNADVLVERYIAAPRHVEVQVFGDTHGNVVHLFERDCSLQRRHQKVIEEAPAPGMGADVRVAMTGAAIRLAKAVGYVGAGTVEFIADGRRGLQPDGFFFMEMNTRLQVEHPVTEAITGLDLVEWQLRVAAGEPLPLRQDEIDLTGHAVEARLYAEDAERGFLPSTGAVEFLRFPEHAGLRVDTGLDPGDAVTPFYDPMIAKLIAHAPDRDAALDLLSASLADTVVIGPTANAGFLRRLADAPEFRASTFDTGLIERRYATPEPLTAARQARLAYDALHENLGWPSEALADAAPWEIRDAFALVEPHRRAMDMAIDGERLSIVAHWQADIDRPGDATQYRGLLTGVSVDHAHHDGEVPSRFRHRLEDDPVLRMIVVSGGRQHRVEIVDSLNIDLETLDIADGEAVIKSPMHGKVILVAVAAGETVHRGQRLAVVEAMKMEHALLAPRDGVVRDLVAQAGQQVAEGERLMVVGEPPE
jgi:3-methylcrotonyl-CoA carboxylase alpha subunit